MTQWVLDNAAATPVPTQWVLDEGAATPMPSMAGRFVRGVNDSVLFGLGDEYMALGSGLGGMVTGEGFSPAYGRKLDQERAIAEQGGAARIAGQVAGGIGLGLATRNPAYIRNITNPGIGAGNLGGAVGRGVVGGATAGGLYGLGSGEGGIGARVENVAIPMITGGAIGGLSNLVGPLIGRVVNSQRPANERMVDKAADTYKKVTGSGPDALKAEMRELGDDAMLADLRGLGRLNEAVVARSPGAADTAEQAFGRRQGGAVDRMESAITNALGQSADDAFSLPEAVRIKQKEIADELYAKTMNTPIPDNLRPEVVEKLNVMLKNPYAKRAMQKGLELQRLEAEGRGEKWVAPKLADMRTLTSIKAGLTGLLEDNYQFGKPFTNEDRLISQFEQNFLDILDEISPDYKAARAATAYWKGVGEAAKKGQKLPNMHINDIRRLTFANEDEHAAFRAGVADAARTMMQGFRREGLGDISNRFRTVGMEDRMAAVLSPEEFADFKKALSAETRFAKTAQNSLGGSATARRMAGMQDLDGPSDSLAQGVIQAGAQGAIGNVPGAFYGASRVGRDIANRWLAPGREADRQALAALLMSSRPDDIQRLIAAMQAGAPLPLAVGNMAGNLTPGAVRAPLAEGME